jgi:crotonobetainyl-CoA:carnitine CoA-transferase CaiB-like acyl-CoA transferase
MSAGAPSVHSGLPLAGVLVVSCEQAVAAPFATRHLADLGARVIKVERPGRGDFARDYDETVHGQSSHFVWLNRSKESITVDLKQPAGVEVVLRLLARADVFVQNLAPGAVDRLGLGPAALAARYPNLVVCSISGYGGDGPYRDAKAYDALVQAEAGLFSITGSADEPAKSGIPVADIGAGVYAYGAIMTALYERERTGRGGVVEVSLFDSLVEWMGFPLYYTRYGGTPPPRTGTHHAAIAPYGSFPTGDGAEVMLAVQNQREWAALASEVLGRPALADDERFATGPARVAHRDQLHGLLTAAFAELTADELAARLDAAGIANARAREVGEVWHHPQVTPRLSDVDTPAGPVAAIGPPMTFPGRPPRMDPVPALGQHTAAVLAELGYDAAEIAALTSSA